MTYATTPAAAEKLVDWSANIATEMRSLGYGPFGEPVLLETGIYSTFRFPTTGSVDVFIRMYGPARNEVRIFVQSLDEHGGLVKAEIIRNSFAWDEGELYDLVIDAESFTVESIRDVGPILVAFKNLAAIVYQSEPTR